MYLSVPTNSEARAYLDRERRETGYVMNLERAWAWRPDVAEAFSALRQQLTGASTLAPREVALLVCSTARALGDSYCALAWGARLATLAGPAFAADILRGIDADTSSRRECALARWAGQVVSDPNGATAAQVDELRLAGLSDREIFEATAFIALRLAFATVNDALGAQPDEHLIAAAPPEVRAAVNDARPSPNRVAEIGSYRRRVIST